MLPACFRLSDHVFPRVRSVAARRLQADGWSQTRTADALGVSQAMVSKYISQPEQEEEPLVVRLADDLLRALSNEAPATGTSPWCTTLTVGGDRPGGEEALQDLLEAEALLRATPPLRVMPEIGLNLARALPRAKDPADVLSYPGRLVQAGAQLLPPAPPAFGASGHLARCLLHLRGKEPDVFALANVRGGPAAQVAADALGEQAARLPPRFAATADERFVRMADRAAAGTRLFHDPGAVGLEPCLYVAGPDARSVARLILALNAKVEP